MLNCICNPRMGNDFEEEDAAHLQFPRVSSLFVHPNWRLINFPFLNSSEVKWLL